MADTPEPSKQAVIVVHGMGEQRPMETLRGFVTGLFSPDVTPEQIKTKSLTRALKNAADTLMPPAGIEEVSDQFWIVPDARTGSSELSRIRAKPQPIGTGGLESDFYELYYSDLLTGNTLQHLWAWFRGLLLRWPHQVPKSQAGLWLLLWTATLVIALLLGSELANSPFGRLKAAWANAVHIETWWTKLSSVAGAALLMWLMSSAYRKHVNTASTKPVDGVIPRSYSAALCLALPPALGVWAYCRLPWSIFTIPGSLLHELRGKSILSQVFILVTGWSLLKMAAAALIAYLVVKMGVPVFGDVARYLRTAPDGVNARSQIRERGLKLLETVHDAKVLAPGAKGEPTAREYSRVVIVAHSLGSIVAFDVLRMFWAKRGANGGKPLSSNALAALDDVDKFCRENPGEAGQNPGWPLEEFVKLQERASAEVSLQDDGWRVTDFVTLGSPLAHAEFLLSRDRPRFEKLIRERVFPTSPPQLDRRVDKGGQKSLLYLSPADGNQWPHHAAMFAVMRWTAIYDPVFGIFFGDFIGGKMRRNFGPAIAEAHTRLSKPGVFKRLVTHTHYWNPKADCELLNEAELPHDIRPGLSAKPHLALLRMIVFRGPPKSRSAPAAARRAGTV